MQTREKLNAMATKLLGLKQHMQAVRDLGCIACKQMGFPDSPAVAHHIRAGGGMGYKASDYETIPLCPTHHTNGDYGTAIHKSEAAFEKRYGTEEELLKQTWREVYGKNATHQRTGRGKGACEIDLTESGDRLQEED